MKGEIQFWGQTHTLNICPSRAASSQLKTKLRMVIFSILLVSRPILLALSPILLAQENSKTGSKFVFYRFYTQN